jgi:oxepin-CoA hydrolase/3-oxo-5,6-dehydrosuberyl-CoA semialdehyde dehydrogenase
MTTCIRSYVCATWVTGTGEKSPLYNPTTEAVVAETSTEGVDFKETLAFARNEGGPALRAMTFAERGEMLVNVAKAIHEYREELIDLAIENGGNTRSDAKFDIDGATGTLSYYGKLGQKLGAEKVLNDGDAIQLTRNPRWVGQHLYTPLRGAAIHINAFNFPAWGMMEKAACALLAGMPVVTKPATSTTLVAYRMAEIAIESGLLPKGSFSFIGGSPGDLLDHADWQDVIAFTGSSDTGLMIRSRENILKHNVRVNVEADSLNAAVRSRQRHDSKSWAKVHRDSPNPNP